MIRRRLLGNVEKSASGLMCFSKGGWCEKKHRKNRPLMSDNKLSEGSWSGERRAAPFAPSGGCQLKPIGQWAAVSQSDCGVRFAAVLESDHFRGQFVVNHKLISDLVAICAETLIFGRALMCPVAGEWLYHMIVITNWSSDHFRCRRKI